MFGRPQTAQQGVPVTRYTFDLPLIASVTIEAADAEAAVRFINNQFDAAGARFKSGGVTVDGEVSLSGDPELAQVEGIDVIQQYSRQIAAEGSIA